MGGYGSWVSLGLLSCESKSLKSMIIWILAFWVAQRFRDIYESQFEDFEIQFQPDLNNVAPHLIWFGLCDIQL